MRTYEWTDPHFTLLIDMGQAPPGMISLEFEPVPGVDFFRI